MEQKNELYHYGRKGMKWGKNIFSKEDLKRLWDKHITGEYYKDKSNQYWQQALRTTPQHYKNRDRLAKLSRGQLGLSKRYEINAYLTDKPSHNAKKLRQEAFKNAVVAALEERAGLAPIEKSLKYANDYKTKSLKGITETKIKKGKAWIDSMIKKTKASKEPEKPVRRPLSRKKFVGKKRGGVYKSDFPTWMYDEYS